jgi:hypothetical protein
VKTGRPEVLEAFDEADWEGGEAVLALEDGEDPLSGLATLEERLGRERLRLALPTIVRARDEVWLLPRVARLLDAGWTRWELSNLAGWGQLGLTAGADARGLDVTADWPLYVTNRAAGLALLDLGARGFTLSPEDGRENLEALLSTFGASATVIVYQHTPLFVSETCPRANLVGCPGRKRCDFRRLDLVSDFGDRVRVLDRNCRAVTVARKPFCLSFAVAELRRAGARSLRVDLQWSELSPEEAVTVWRRVRAGDPIPDSHAGNYFRRL